jgi:hypothetical protein
LPSNQQELQQFFQLRFFKESEEVFFNELMTMGAYDADGPNDKFPIATDIGKLKAIAGGANADKYREWKEKHESEPIDVEKADADAAKQAKKRPSVILKEKLIKASKGLYRRRFATGAIFKKKTDYYYTHALNDPKEFLNEIFIDDEMYQMCSQSDHKELLHFIKDIAHPEFPFMKFIYFMLGRALTTLNDKFDFMVMLVGVGGAGKSLLMSLLCYAFGGDQIGTLSSTFQDRFGLSEFADKQLVASDDMPRNIAKTLPKSDFLAMQSRGHISCPVKGKTSIEINSWDIPTVINSVVEQIR